MANNGYSHTKKIFREYFWKDKLIPIMKDDSNVDCLIKSKINNFIIKHGYQYRSSSYNNEMIQEEINLLNKINQIRFKYWHFANLKTK